MKIYTRRGDAGKTGLLGGVRVSKSDLVIEVIGCLDETNCWLGSVRCELGSGELSEGLVALQGDLFALGGRIAAGPDSASEISTFFEKRAGEIEAWIDSVEASLEPLKAFILPGGSRAGGALHLARSVCRRAERRLVALADSSPEGCFSSELGYLNRLSDLLFVLARLANREAGAPETIWDRKGRK